MYICDSAEIEHGADCKEMEQVATRRRLLYFLGIFVRITLAIEALIAQTILKYKFR